MGNYNYNNITLDRDRAFDNGNLNELLTQGKNILSEAIRISGKMEEAISNISSTYDGIDGAYKVSALGADINRLAGTLVKSSYQETIDRMDKILTKLMEDMPGYDSSLAKSMDQLQEVITAISSRVEDLKSLLDGGAVELGYEEFRGRLKELKTGWEQSTEDIREILAGIEGDMLGVTAAAIQYSKDPVNLSTGNFVYDHEDLKIDGEIPLTFHRYYNAKDRAKGNMGRSFRHNYEMNLTMDEEHGKITVCMQDGQRKIFRKNADGNYEGRNSVMEVLTEERGENNGRKSSPEEDSAGDAGNAEKGFCLTMQDGYRYHFAESGRLARQEDRNGRGIAFSYNEEGRLSRAVNDHGAFLCYAYDEGGQLVKVEDHTGRTVELSYEKKRLTAVKTPQGSIYRYAYAGNGRIAETINPGGITTVQNEYDEKHRITRQIFPDGGCMEYDYEEESRKVILTEQNGNKITYVHDARYRNTDIVYEDGTKEHFGYNEKNRRVLYMDRNGNVIRYAYDARGNLTQVINALGKKINLTYGENDCLLKMTVNGKEKLLNKYDAKGNLVSSKGADGRGSSLTYDQKGRVTRFELADKSAITFKYDEKGNLVFICDETGKQTFYEYDNLNRVICKTDGNGNKFFYEYDLENRIKKVINPFGDSRCYRYNKSGKVVYVKDFDGYHIEITYNSLNKIESVRDKEGNITRITYDKMWNVAGLEQADGGKKYYLYDENNRLSKEIFPQGGVVTYTYDGNGNRTSMTDGEGNTTLFTYDALNRVTSIREANGATTFYAYDDEGNLVNITDALGNVTTYTYDGMGRRTSVTDVLGNKTSVSYGDLGRIECVRYPNGSSMIYKYSLGGRLESREHSDGSGEKYQYDKNGNLVCRENSLGEKVRIEYDSLNRRIAETNPRGGIRRYEYDKAGNLIKIIDESGNVTRYEYSPNRNRIKIVDSLGNETGFYYDCRGQLVKIIRGGISGEISQETSYTRDLEGNILTITDPMGGMEKYSYDKTGKVISKIDRDGFRTEFSYNHFGKVAGIDYADGKHVDMVYDPLHRLSEMHDWQGSMKIQRDALGRPVKVTEADGTTVGYEWGCMGEKKSLIYPDGQKAEYEYNDAMRLMKLQMGNEAVTYVYDKIGRVIEKCLPNEVVTKYSYNDIGRVESLQYVRNTELIEAYHFDYDIAGNKVQMQKVCNEIPQPNVYNYVYNQHNRLVTVLLNEQILRSYQYDAFGNRIVKVDFSDGDEKYTQYTYNLRNELIQEKEGALEKSYFYDRRGNLNRVTIGETLLHYYQYDACNRLSAAESMKTDGVEQAYYGYNGMGQRVSQNIYRGKNRNELTAIKEISYTLDLTRQYHNLLHYEDVLEGKSQNFYWDGNVVALSEKQKNNYYLQDDLGSTVRLTDEAGKSIALYEYDEFGNAVQKDNCMRVIQPFGYTGYQMDETSGIYFAQARRYDAKVGRFVSEDPIHYGSNWYVYAENSPINKIDPLGLVCDELSQSGTDNIYELVQGDYESAPFWLELFGYWNRHFNPIYRIWANETKKGTFDEIFSLFDFEKGEDGNYHVNTEKYRIDIGGNTYVGCWQQFGGYNHAYDFIFDIFCDMDAEIFDFTTKEGDSYTIWMWKGDYLNLGAGGECGIYYGDGWQKWAAVDNALPMTLHVDYGDGHSSDWADTTWWITSFNPYEQGTDVNNITITGTIDCSEFSDDMWEAFVNRWGIENSIFEFDEGSRIVTYTW